jgi:hypothetical protein
LHALPQVPQFWGVEDVAVSQPLAAAPSQLPHPGSQAVTRHVPVLHDSVAWARSHAVPQVPQSVSVCRLVSQPSVATPLQSAHPALQLATVHCEFAQPAVPFGAEHSAPHPPQLFGSVVVVVSHPLPGLLSQSAVPGTGHVEHPQTPVVHFGVHPAVGHLFGQLPQWFTSLLRFTSHPLLGSPSQSW